MTDQTVSEFPPIAAALKSVAADGYGYGDILEHEYLYRILDIEYPKCSTQAIKAQELRLEFLAAFKRLEKRLQEEYGFTLESETSVGYRIVPPSEVHKFRARETVKAFDNEARKNRRAAQNTRLEHMQSDSDRREHCNGMAKLSKIAGIVRKEMRQPFIVDHSRGPEKRPQLQIPDKKK